MEGAISSAVAGSHDVFVYGSLMVDEVVHVLLTRFPPPSPALLPNLNDNTAGGRYICYDRIIQRAEEAVELNRQLGIPYRNFFENSSDRPAWFELCNRKLSRLLSARRRCSYDIYYSYQTD